MRIAHISDLHVCTGDDFNENVFDKGADIINKLDPVPDFVFVSGDFTTNGLLSEYDMAKEKLRKINYKTVAVPGNHDERNLGYKLFPEYFGRTDFTKEYDNLLLIGVASSEPDKDEGKLGRGRHRIIEDAIMNKREKIPVIGFHHHLVPVPNSGREKNIIEDAGETLDIILKNGVPLVLMGHRHVPYAVKIHNTLLVNAGTFSCNRTRAHFGNTFNIIDINNHDISITVVNVRKEEEKKMVHFNQKKGVYVNRYYPV